MRLGSSISIPSRGNRTFLKEGLIAGTSVLTLDGALPVEHLTPGDRIVTRDSGLVILRAVTARKATARMIRIKPHVLGNNRPKGDVVLPADQKVLLRDWRAKAIYGQKTAVVPVERLIDGQYVTEHSEASTVTLFTLELDGPHIIYADGLELSASEHVAA